MLQTIYQTFTCDLMNCVLAWHNQVLWITGVMYEVTMSVCVLVGVPKHKIVCQCQETNDNEQSFMIFIWKWQAVPVSLQQRTLGAKICQDVHTGIYSDSQNVWVAQSPIGCRPLDIINSKSMWRCKVNGCTDNACTLFMYLHSIHVLLQVLPPPPPHTHFCCYSGTHTHTYTHSSTHMHWPTNTCTHTHTHTHSSRQTQVCTHAHTVASHTHTHTHMHTCICTLKHTSWLLGVTSL